MLLSGQLFGGNLVAAGVALVLVIAAVMWLLSIVGSAISFGGFRACRHDNRIEVERGLLQHQFQGVSVDRVQSVIVKQSFIRRLLGYCELSLGKIDAAAESSDEQQKSLSQGLVVHPFVKMSRVPEILAGLVPEFAGVPVESTPVAPVRCDARLSVAASSRERGCGSPSSSPSGSCARTRLSSLTGTASSPSSISTPAPSSAMRCASCCSCWSW